MTKEEIVGMGDAQKLKDRYEANLKELQGTCPHIKSEWMPYSWALGHYAGKRKVCLNCWKVLEDSMRPIEPESEEEDGED